MEGLARLKRWVGEMIDRRWYRWHPTVALRFLPIVEEMRRFQVLGSKVRWRNLLVRSHPLTFVRGGLKTATCSRRKFANFTSRRQESLKRDGYGQTLVVEVGSGGLGIAPYLKSRVIGVDKDFSGPTVSGLVKVNGVGERLPLKDKCADWVVLVDVLEHVAKKERLRLVDEAVRVSKRWVVIAQPCGELAEGQDRELDRLYRERLGEEHPFLGEHVEYGLPSQEEVGVMIRKAVRKQGRKMVKVKVIGNMNIRVRRWLMRGWMTRSPLVDLFFRKGLLLAIPVLRRCNWEPVYRRIWVVELS
jgi:hypothetical protein